mmetsp:Transcript_35440/g.67848  ORF Transcript_35440/g.67848 Transcript_35440/m.67848 type:complete len:562 (+) Transcript_35440:234-1919(+)
MCALLPKFTTVLSTLIAMIIFGPAHLTWGQVHPKDAGLPCVFYDKWHEIVDLTKETPGPEYPMVPVRPARSPPTIFVGTSSYRDRACPKTLFDAFLNAAHPERLFLGLVDQVEYGDEDCVDAYCRLWQAHLNDTKVCPYFQHIKLTQLPSMDAKGPTKARHFQGDLIDGQDFCMQVDSHTMFAKDWDKKLLEAFYLTNNENAVLTTYLPGHENYGIENMANHYEVPHLCNLQWSSGKILKNAIAAAAANLPRPKLTGIWAAGFSFSKCHAELLVPYDDSLPQTFDGEEISRAARFFTHGYDMYTPHRNYIWHIYKRQRRGEWYADGRDSSKKRKYEVYDAEAENGQTRQANEKAKSISRLQQLFGLPGASGEDLGVFGLGSKRTLEQFWDFVGVNHTADQIDNPRKCGELVWVPWIKPSSTIVDHAELDRGRSGPKIDVRRTEPNAGSRQPIDTDVLQNTGKTEGQDVPEKKYKIGEVVQHMAATGERFVEVFESANTQHWASELDSDEQRSATVVHARMHHMNALVVVFAFLVVCMLLFCMYQGGQSKSKMPRMSHKLSC